MCICVCCVPLPLCHSPFLHSLLFYSSGPRVDFMKLNKLTAMGTTKCSPHTDTVVCMTLDIASERVYWVTVRYSRLLLNWADYKNENCSYRLVDTIGCMHTSIRDICMYNVCRCYFMLYGQYLIHVHTYIHMYM